MLGDCVGRFSVVGNHVGHSVGLYDGDVVGAPSGGCFFLNSRRPSTADCLFCDARATMVRRAFEYFMMAGLVGYVWLIDLE